jgi:hypothetical protein
MARLFDQIEQRSRVVNLQIKSRAAEDANHQNIE